jgi:hypothetical protein
MRWMIHGADHKTGRELTIIVDADDPQEAEHRALYNDILVSSIQEFTAAMLSQAPEPAAPALDYCAPDSPPASRPPLGGAPFYRPILAGARWLDGLSSAIRIAGFIALLAALVTTLVPLFEPVREWLPFTIIPLLWFIGSGLLMVIAFLCLFLGASIALLSELALALRDMARNSFRTDLPPPLPETCGGRFGPVRAQLGDQTSSLGLSICTSSSPYAHPLLGADRP